MNQKANTQVNTFGAMIGFTDPEHIEISDNNAVIGMTFDKKGVPIEIAQIMLAGKNAKNFTILLADEFVMMNGTSEQDAKIATDNTIEVIKNLSKLYGYSPNIILASDIMNTPRYADIIEMTHADIHNLSLEEKLRESIPENRTDSPLDYAEHEIACIRYLTEDGIDLKIGPEREKHYDTVMKDLEIPVSFAYLPPAFAVATNYSEPVNHYNGASRGKKGQRIHFGDIHEYPIREKKIEQQLNQTRNDKAARALLMIAGASAEARNTEALNIEPTYTLKKAREMTGRDLYKAAKQEITDHLILPYREVIA